MPITTRKLLGIALAADFGMPDEPRSLPQSRDDVAEETGKVFDVGDQTVGLIRNQVFAFDEYGTIVSSLKSTAIQVATEVPAENTLRRVERKLDAASRTLAALQRRIESIDRVLARLINRA